MRYADQDIGGAIVRRQYRDGDRVVLANTRLSRTEVLAIRNRQSMADRGQLAIIPRHDGEGKSAAAATAVYDALMSSMVLGGPADDERPVDYLRRIFERVLQCDAQETLVVNAGFGRFDVVEGRKLNDKPLAKPAAMKLARKSEKSET